MLQLCFRVFMPPIDKNMDSNTNPFFARNFGYAGGHAGMEQPAVREQENAAQRTKSKLEKDKNKLGRYLH